MPGGLRRIHGGGNLHFITTSCYRREPLLHTARRRDMFLRIFEPVRQSYDFEVIGFVIMPEHIHLLISEPRRDTIPMVVQVLKQRVAVRLLSKRKPGSQNVYSDRKVTEKLRYMHRNPVERGLVSSPELWRWSSYRAFAFLEEGTVKLNWQQPSNKGKTGKVPKQEIANGISAHPPNTTESRAPTLWFVHHKTK